MQMARGKPLTSTSYVKLPDGTVKEILRIDENGTVTWAMDEEEWAVYRDKILKNIGREMSLYYSSHPEKDPSVWSIEST